MGLIPVIMNRNRSEATARGLCRETIRKLTIIDGETDE